MALVLSMVAHTFKCSTQEAEAGGALFEASLVYMMASRPARDTQRQTKNYWDKAFE